MALKKKKKLKVKNFIIFIIIILVILFSIYKIGKFIVKKLFNEKEEILTKTKSEIKKEKKNEENKVDNLKEKYKKLENINEKINFFIEENIDRYISYKEKNSNLSLEQVIINVNIGLDNKFYTNVKPAPNLDKYNVLVNKYRCTAADDHAYSPYFSHFSLPP